MSELASFKQAMRLLVTGVSIIATRSALGGWHGLTATAVTSATAEPPTLLCCVNRSASAAPHIAESGVFSVNLLPISATGVSQRFSGQGPAEERFTPGEWLTLATGAPILRAALTAFDCRILQQMQVGTHFIFLGQVEAIHLAEAPAQPLLYGMGAYGAFQPRDAHG